MLKVSRFEPEAFEIERGGHVANSNLGNGILRPETFDLGAANEPQTRWDRLGRPTTAAASRGNIVLFCGLGNHVDLRGLSGGDSNLDERHGETIEDRRTLRNGSGAQSSPP
jgi:hypothetical protein